VIEGRDDVTDVTSSTRLDQMAPSAETLSRGGLDHVFGTLLPAETLVWEGRPQARRLISRGDFILIPWTCLSLAFAAMWELELWNGTGLQDPNAGFLTRISLPTPLPFILLCLYIIGPRLWVRRRLRSQTRYAVTTHRVLVYQGFLGKQLQQAMLTDISAVEMKSDLGGLGQLVFRPRKFQLRQPLMFDDLSGAAEVAQAIRIQLGQS